HPPGHDRVEDIAVAPRPGRAEPMALIASAAPLSSADAVAHLRSEAISLIYDPVARSLTADTPRAERITIG
ncbi:hypothetical protein KN815_13930, partial [Streptomyces sp. 4503]|nr:hypothetical protein [Streptomyces niphimycinicus]